MPDGQLLVGVCFLLLVVLLLLLLLLLHPRRPHCVWVLVSVVGLGALRRLLSTPQQHTVLL